MQLEALARATTGDVRGALTLFQRFMSRGFAKNRGWAQQLYWGSNETGRGKRAEQLVGTDPLNDSLVAMWGVLQAVFGVRLSLGRVSFADTGRHPLPEELEGARWTFSWRGKPFCVKVSNGRSLAC